MTYREAVHYLLQQLPMFQRVGAAAYRSDLTNIRQLCAMLGNPQQELKCIHVAGTNGKGSVSHIISSVLQEQGYRVGLFISPHYKDYRERIKINGQYISRSFVTRFVQNNIDNFRPVNASFFEITTAMAFAYFKEKKVDFAVIETGMGGRLDSTNIITPLLSVITNISFDHQQFLGNTLPAIAGEKAGIIKSSVPVVIGEMQKETAPVFETHAKAKNAAIYFADKQKEYPHYTTDLQGGYQQKNIRTSLCAISVLQENGVQISTKAIKKGLKNVYANTRFMGRWMIMQRKPLVIFDSAHNEGGLRLLLKELQNIRYKKLHFVYGTVNDKDIATNLKLLPKEAEYYFCKADMPRGLDAKLLQQQAGHAGLAGNSYKSVKSAYRTALKNARATDVVLVAGSVFVVAEVL